MIIKNTLVKNEDIRTSLKVAAGHIYTCRFGVIPGFQVLTGTTAELKSRDDGWFVVDRQFYLPDNFLCGKYPSEGLGCSQWMGVP
jgi:hypothetical protein